MRYVNPPALPGNGGGRFSPIEKYRAIAPSKVTLKKLLKPKNFFFDYYNKICFKCVREFQIKKVGIFLNSKIFWRDFFFEIKIF